MFEELAKVIEQFGRDKGIDRKMVVEAIETAMVTAAKKKMGPHIEVEAHYNEDNGEIEMYQFKTVVEDGDVADPDIEVELEEARKEDSEVELGDSIGIKLDSAAFGRIAAQTAKQVINQKIRDAEREIIYSEFLARKGEIISGIVRRYERGTIVIDLGKTEAFMPPKEQIPGEQPRIGDRMQAYLLDVLQTAKGPQIILSRATNLYLVKLFEMEVPEVHEGIVTIKSAARDAGSRAKIAVASKDKDVDPVGACVGVRGARVQNIVSELKGERIDIIPYQADIAKFVCSALSPAEVSKVKIDESSKYMEVVVPDGQLSLAIGRRGQNVRLAAQLTGWKIDVVSETDMSRRYDDAKFSLTQIPGITETIATALFQNGYRTIFEVAEADPEEIVGIPGFENLETSTTLVANAKNMVASGKVIVKTEDEKFTVATVKKTADELLREEMQQLLEKEKEHVAAASGENVLLKVRGMGPSLIKAISEKGIDNVEAISAMTKEAFIAAIEWENKDELGNIYDNAILVHNEKLISDGKKDDISDDEKKKFQLASEVTKSTLLRLAAAGFTTVDSVVSISVEEFATKMGLDDNKSASIYNAIKAAQ